LLQGWHPRRENPELPGKCTVLSASPWGKTTVADCYTSTTLHLKHDSFGVRGQTSYYDRLNRRVRCVINQKSKNRTSKHNLIRDKHEFTSTYYEVKAAKAKLKASSNKQK